MSETQQFGEYHLLDLIATGGMAEVWRARAEGMAGFEKILVIKKILEKFSSNKEFVKLFIHEARISVPLVHANLVQVYELGEVNGTYFMAMEYVNGLDLARLLQQGQKGMTIPISVAAFIGCEVLKALSFAHERTDGDGKPLEIVHCDISPQNILLSRAGEVKITDFGISHAAFQSSSGQSGMHGKLAYMSPEQVSRESLDCRSDIFSLGIVLYEMLAGRRLFKCEKREETIDRICRGAVPALSKYRADVPEALQSCIHRALSPVKEDRFESAGKMLEAMSKVMVHEGYRVSNTNLSEYIDQLLDGAESSTLSGGEEEDRLPRQDVLILALCAGANNGSQLMEDSLAAQWFGKAVECCEALEGGVLERNSHSALICWMGPNALSSLDGVIDALHQVQQSAKDSNLCFSVGLVPGRVPWPSGSNTPGGQWQMSPPFFLARWMMNYGIGRRQWLMTEQAAKHVKSWTVMPAGEALIAKNMPVHLWSFDPT